MRVKDETKQQAVIDATIKVVNEIGFASASISKIAKEAGVSAATIYVYHANKDDLIINTYYEVKRQLTQVYYADMDKVTGVKAKLRMFWGNVIRAGSRVPRLISFAEQFGNAPMADHVDKERLGKYALPIVEVLTQGVEEKVIKDISIEIFIALFVAPANYLGNRKVCQGFQVSEDSVAQTFDLVWKSIEE